MSGEKKFCEDPEEGIPCIQGPAIAKMDSKLDKVVEALQTLAAQDVKINNLTETTRDHREWLKGHEVRIQVLERLPGKTASKTLWMLGGGVVTVMAGIILYALTHWIG